MKTNYVNINPVLLNAVCATIQQCEIQQWEVRHILFCGMMQPPLSLPGIGAQPAFAVIATKVTPDTEVIKPPVIDLTVKVERNAKNYN